MIKNAFIRIVDGKTNREMCKYDLSEDYSGMTAMIFGEIYRHNGEWKFNAIGQGQRIQVSVNYADIISDRAYAESQKKFILERIDSR